MQDLSEVDRNAKQIDDYLKRQIPKRVRNAVLGQMTTSNDIRKTMLLREDVAHREAHVLDALTIFSYLALVLNLDPVDKFLGDNSIRFHDIGNRLVETKVVTPNEHHFASMILTSFIYPDLRVIKAIRHHIDDVLPRNTQLWVRAFRDGDRVSATGFAGANRLARLFGHVDPELDILGHDEIIRRGIFWDMRYPPRLSSVLFDKVSERERGKLLYKYPMHDDYDMVPAKYFVDKVMPFLIETRQVERFCEFIKWIGNRVRGGTFMVENRSNFVGVVGDAEGKTTVEPVIKDAIELFQERLWATEKISSLQFYMDRDSQDYDYRRHLLNGFPQAPEDDRDFGG